MAKNLVSLCIPTYNGEEYLEETLRSADSQTYPEIEILISDDGSTDRTLEIAERFRTSSRFPVRILSHGQLGLVQNWNFCVREAGGKYIKFLFQDDLLEPGCVEEMTAVADKDDETGLVFSRRDVILGNQVPDEAWRRTNWFYLDLFRHWSKLETLQSGVSLLSDPKFLEEPLNKIGEPTTVLLRKSAIERVGLFDENLRQAVDSEMWFRILARYKCGFVDKTLSTFRVHEKQASQSNVDAGIVQEDYCAVLAKIATNILFAAVPEEHRCQAWVKAWRMNPRNTGLSSLILARIINQTILRDPFSRKLLIQEAGVKPLASAFGKAVERLKAIIKAK